MAGGGPFSHSNEPMKWAEGKAGGQNIAMAPSAA